MAGESVTVVARELGIRRKSLHRWRDEGWGTAGQGKTVQAEPSAASARDREHDALKKKIAGRFGDSPPWYEVADCLLALRSPSRLK
jgi:transposase-like protein